MIEYDVTLLTLTQALEFGEENTHKKLQAASYVY